ncbi:MAG: DUF3006 domain-containing protein [Patescibacteria group bacterium]
MAKSTTVTLQCTVDRFENGLVVLGFSRGEQLTIAKKYLPRGIKVGDYLSVEFLTDELAAKRREHLARAMLEEIFNGRS